MRHIASRPPCLLLLLVAPGCAVLPPAAATTSAPPPAVKAAAPPAPATSENPDRHAQRVWCGYLDALYRRAGDGRPWPRHGECLANHSNASPSMLERTASCSRHALDNLPGDPLTPEHALAVKRCGIAAIEASSLSEGETEPYLETLCRRAERCEAASYGECRSLLHGAASARLGRALGALNEGSRARIRTCLGEDACDTSFGERITTCVEPIMEGLLWLPEDSDG